MNGRGVLEAVAGPDGHTRLVRCSGTPPLTPRVTGRRGTATVHLSATAGGPLPGDRFDLTITVGPRASLVVRSVGATVALPGPHPQAPESRWRIRADVAAGGSLTVLGEPLVAAAGCRHRSEAEVDLADDARLVWRDVLVPGRHGEAAGSASLLLRVRRTGRPVLTQELAVGPAAPGWNGPAVLGNARCVGSLLLAGPDAWRPPGSVLADGAVLVPLAAPGAALATALGDAPSVLARLDAWRPAADDAATAGRLAHTDATGRPQLAHS